jgi:hypothetical protein
VSVIPVIIVNKIKPTVKWNPETGDSEITFIVPKGIVPQNVDVLLVNKVGQAEETFTVIK